MDYVIRTPSTVVAVAVALQAVADGMISIVAGALA